MPGQLFLQFSMDKPHAGRKEEGKEIRCEAACFLIWGTRGLRKSVMDKIQL